MSNCIWQDIGEETLPLTLLWCLVHLTGRWLMCSIPFHWDCNRILICHQVRSSRFCWCKKFEYRPFQSHKVLKSYWRRDRLSTNMYHNRFFHWLQQFQPLCIFHLRTIHQQGKEFLLRKQIYNQHQK